MSEARWEKCQKNIIWIYKSYLWCKKAKLKRTFILTGTLNHIICRERNNLFGVYNKSNENLPYSASIPAPYKQGSANFSFEIFLLNLKCDCNRLWKKCINKIKAFLKFLFIVLFWFFSHVKNKLFSIEK